jgi:polyhydroxyalkanoate synthesis regulator phasin
MLKIDLIISIIDEMVEKKKIENEKKKKLFDEMKSQMETDLKV